MNTSHSCRESPCDRGHGIRLQYLSGMFWLIFQHSKTSQTVHAVILSADNHVCHVKYIFTRLHLVMGVNRTKW